jgi:hypothetical protein
MESRLASVYPVAGKAPHGAKRSVSFSTCGGS